MNRDYKSRKLSNRQMSQQFLHYKAKFEIMNRKIREYEHVMNIQRQAAIDYDDY